MKKTKTKNKSAKNAKKSKGLIKKNMYFSELMLKYPKAAEILMKRGMHCFGCSMSANETIEQGAIMHGWNPDKLVKELNMKIKK